MLCNHFFDDIHEQISELSELFFSQKIKLYELIIKLDGIHFYLQNVGSILYILSKSFSHIFKRELKQEVNTCVVVHIRLPWPCPRSTPPFNSFLLPPVHLHIFFFVPMVGLQN